MNAKAKKLKQKLKQKIMGAGLIIISILAPIILDGDATISVLLFPLGLYMLITKERMVEE
jgi:hypothetical protein